jgi:hypothetical protein
VKELIYLLSFFSLGRRYYIGSLVCFFVFFVFFLFLGAGRKDFVVFFTKKIEILLLLFFWLGVNCKLD